MNNPWEMSAEEVVKDFFKFRNEKNLEQMEQLIIKGRRGAFWSFERQEYVKLISIAEHKSDIQLKDWMEKGTGQSLQPYAVKFFIVEYEISYLGGGWPDSGRESVYYVVVKETKDSPWLIAGWGH